MALGDKPIVFDRANLELRTVRFFFADANDSLKIVWEDGIKAGAVIEEGDLLATIKWTSSPEQELLAPVGCEGTVESTNRQIAYEELGDWGIWLLSLEEPGE
jgi:hypothetical protein